MAGPGNGYVDMFDLQGNMLSRLVTRAELDAPWGIVAHAGCVQRRAQPAADRQLRRRRILSYAVEPNDTSAPATFEGALRDENSDDLVIDGLWALEFGPDTGDFSSDQLYFTAGPNDEETASSEASRRAPPPTAMANRPRRPPAPAAPSGGY